MKERFQTIVQATGGDESIFSVPEQFRTGQTNGGLGPYMNGGAKSGQGMQGVVEKNKVAVSTPHPANFHATAFLL